MSFGTAGPRATDRLKQNPCLDPRLLRFLEKLSTGQFFGKVVLSFQNGKPVDVRIEQTKKLDEL
jgi:hypothetical protein